MMFTLARYGYPPWGTFGRITGPEFEFPTVERPWMGNLPWVSCIPEGVYPMKMGMFNRGGYPAWEVLDVPGRSLIKIHIANLPRELHGCVGIGSSHGVVGGEWGVVRSRSAFREFMRATARVVGAGDGDRVELAVVSLRGSGRL